MVGSAIKYSGNLFPEIAELLFRCGVVVVGACGALALAAFSALGDAKDSPIILSLYVAAIDIGLNGIVWVGFGVVISIVMIVLCKKWNSDSGAVHDGSYAQVFRLIYALLLICSFSFTVVPLLYGLKGLMMITTVARIHVICDAQNIDKERLHEVVVRDCADQIKIADDDFERWANSTTWVQRLDQYIRDVGFYFVIAYMFCLLVIMFVSGRDKAWY